MLWFSRFFSFMNDAEWTWPKGRDRGKRGGGVRIRRGRVKESIRDQPKKKRKTRTNKRAGVDCRGGSFSSSFLCVYNWKRRDEEEDRGVSTWRNVTSDRNQKIFGRVPLDLAWFATSKICFVSHCRQSILVRPKGRGKRQRTAPGCAPVNGRERKVSRAGRITPNYL